MSRMRAYDYVLLFCTGTRAVQSCAGHMAGFSGQRFGFLRKSSTLSVCAAGCPLANTTSKRIRLFFLFLALKIAASLALVVFAPRIPLLVQVLDVIKVPSTIYMPDVSCDACNSFNPGYAAEPSADSSDTDRQDVFLLNLVISDVSNFDRRRAIRDTWGSVTQHHNHRIRTRFVVGRYAKDGNRPTSDAKVVNDRLLREMRTYHDVVQLNASDDYRYLTNKSIATLRWATWRYPDAKFLLKSDDDSLNVIGRFVDYLDSAQPLSLIAGMCSSGEQPHRHPDHKWHVSVETYPGRVYPVHAKGRAYVLSQDAARRIVAASPGVRFNPMEDLYVTGLCRAVVGLSCTHLEHIPNRNEDVTDCNVATSVYNVHHVGPTDMRRLWALAVNETARDVCNRSGWWRTRS